MPARTSKSLVVRLAARWFCMVNMTRCENWVRTNWSNKSLAVKFHRTIATPQRGRGCIEPNEGTHIQPTTPHEWLPCSIVDAPAVTDISKLLLLYNSLLTRRSCLWTVVQNTRSGYVHKQSIVAPDKLLGTKSHENNDCVVQERLTGGNTSLIGLHIVLSYFREFSD